MDSFVAGKKIVVGLSGSIAAFKVAGWVSALTKAEADVDVVLTQGACKFITPLTFSALSGKCAYTDMFDTGAERIMSHIDLGRDADLLLLAPASANLIARLAHGMADDLLTTSVLAARCPVVVCPAMNPHMYKHPATQNNISRLREFGYTVIEPDCGRVACKEDGQGRLPEWEVVREVLATKLIQQDLAGEHVLITAGPTREPLDPARFLSNRSSGKMGYAIARVARRRGATVLLVSGPTALVPPEGVELIQVETASEMHSAVMSHADHATIIVKSAAVADFKPAVCSVSKVKKEQAEKEISLLQNPDILFELGTRKRNGQILVGFAAESDNFIEEGRKKLECKNLDMIAVNNICSENTGFESETNQLHLLTKGCNEPLTLPLTTKDKTAQFLIDHIVAMRAEMNKNVGSLCQ